jgi:hypothetical protein
MSPERTAEIRAELEKIVGPKPIPKPKVVTRDDIGPIRDADVVVSRADVNANGEAETVSVRRPEYVTINMVEYERQQWERAWQREHRRRIDPLGIWGPLDDDE